MVMRSLIFALVIVLSGCVSQPMPEGFERTDDFDQVEAAKTRISLGLTYLRNGNYTQAKHNLDKALEFAPRLADAHYSIAYYYQIVGEVVRAENAYEDALRLAPRNPDIANSYGAFLCQQSRYEEAKSFFEKAVNSQTYANSAETYENMAICSLSQSQTSDAINYLRTALNHQPTRGKSLLLLSEVLVEQEQFEEAKQVLIRYQRVARVSANSLWLAVQIESGLGQAENAKGYGDMLLSLYPGHELTQKYRIEKDNYLPKAQVVNKPKSATEPVMVPQSTPEDVKAPVAKTVQNVQPQDTMVETTEDLEPNVPAIVTADPELMVDTTTKENMLEESALQHIVLAGENLYRISLKYNVKMQRLIEWNQLDSNGAVYQGMKLWIVDPALTNSVSE